METDIIKQISISLLALFLIAGYIFFFVQLLRRKDIQPIKSKSYKLLLICLIGNFCSLIVILGTIISTLQENSQDAKISAHIGIILSEIVCAPIMFISYIARAIQLSKIYNISTEEDLEITRSNWFSQMSYLKMIVGIFLVSAAGGAWLTYSSATSIMLGQHHGFDSVLIVTSMTINFLGAFLFAVYGMRTISERRNDIEMKTEIISLVTFWTCCSCGFHFLMIHENDQQNIRDSTETIVIVLSSIIILLRNLVSFIISIVYPVLHTSNSKIIPYGETRDCTSNVEITLATELPFIYFSYFIESVAGNNGKYLVTCYTQLKLYEDLVEKGDAQQEAYAMASEIERNYLKEESEMKIEGIPIEIMKNLEKKLCNLKVNLDKHLYDPLYGFILNKLQEYYVAFKQSEVFKELCCELRNNEIIYERLLNAELI